MDMETFPQNALSIVQLIVLLVNHKKYPRKNLPIKIFDY